MKKKNVRTMAATAMVGVMTASVGITACAAPQMNQMQGGKGQVGIEAGMQDSEMPQGMSQMPGGQKNDNQQAPDGQNNTDQQAPDGQYRYKLILIPQLSVSFHLVSEGNWYCTF